MIAVATTLDPTLWKPSAEAGRVFAALSDSGEPQILFVGGCVRNAVLGLPPGDYDLATVHAPEEVTRRLQAAGIKVVPTGIAHGTVTAVVDGHPFEITTLRQDVETDGRRAVVAFTDDWAEDAQRRDFTMNTLLADLDGRVYDPTGRGLADLRAGRVVFVGDPGQRIAEDYLRILRFFRFHALYGRGAPDAAALDACWAAADKIATLSRERITQETERIVAVDDPADILGLMRGQRVMADLFHPRCDLAALNALARLQKQAEMISVAARLAMLAAGDTAHMAVFEKYLLLSRERQKSLESLFIAMGRDIGLPERLYRFGREVAGQSLLIRAAMGKDEVRAEEIEMIRYGSIPVFPMGGNDLKVLGVDAGPRMGVILHDLEEWWIAQNFTPDHDQCLDQARITLKD